LPLTYSKPGESACIKKVGGMGDTKKHLENLGFVPGSLVTVVTKLGENVIVNVKGARIALSREMASKILI
jgi:ferrous iron transport protein A